MLLFGGFASSFGNRVPNVRAASLANSMYCGIYLIHTKVRCIWFLDHFFSWKGLVRSQSVLFELRSKSRAAWLGWSGWIVWNFRLSYVAPTLHNLHKGSVATMKLWNWSSRELLLSSSQSFRGFQVRRHLCLFDFLLDYLDWDLARWWSRPSMSSLPWIQAVNPWKEIFLSRVSRAFANAEPAPCRLCWACGTSR